MILDGYPRDLKQLEYLEEAVSRNTIYIELLCSDKLCVQRAAKRRRCDDSTIQQRLKKHASESKFYQYMDTIKIDVSAKTDTDVYEAVKSIIETTYWGLENNSFMRMSLHILIFDTINTRDRSRDHDTINKEYNS